MLYVVVQASFVAENFQEQEDKVRANPAAWTETVDCRRFRMPSGTL